MLPSEIIDFSQSHDDDDDSLYANIIHSIILDGNIIYYGIIYGNNSTDDDFTNFSLFNFQEDKILYLDYNTSYYYCIIMKNIEGRVTYLIDPETKSIVYNHCAEEEIFDQEKINRIIDNIEKKIALTLEYLTELNIANYLPLNQILHILYPKQQQLQLRIQILPDPPDAQKEAEYVAYCYLWLQLCIFALTIGRKLAQTIAHNNVTLYISTLLGSTSLAAMVSIGTTQYLLGGVSNNLSTDRQIMQHHGTMKFLYYAICHTAPNNIINNTYNAYAFLTYTFLMLSNVFIMLSTLTLESQRNNTIIYCLYGSALYLECTFLISEKTRDFLDSLFLPSAQQGEISVQ